MDKEKATVTIAKFDPAKDEKPVIMKYAAPYVGMTVLQVLDHVYEQQDPGLAYRFGCCGAGSARCGACAIEVNGEPVLACKKEADRQMEIGPHAGFEVVKDLVIDFEKPKDPADG